MASIEQELEYYKKLFGTADVATRAYISVVKMLEQHIEHLSQFKLIEHIKNKDADSPQYKRTMEIYESMPDMISKLHKLKVELNIEYVEEIKQESPITPESIAKRKQIYNVPSN